jgi:mRNA interferase YafQ
MYSIHRGSSFRKDLKRELKNPRFKKSIFLGVVDALANGKQLDPRHRNHKLTGEFSNCFECHLLPDLLLIYTIDRKERNLYLVRIGSHAELFG